MNQLVEILPNSGVVRLSPDARCYALRNAGLRHEQIAEQTGQTPEAVRAAIARHDGRRRQCLRVLRGNS